MDLAVFGVGVTDAATALSTAFTADNIWDQVTPFIPVIGVITLAALGIYFVRRITKKASRGKGGM
jgi:hypothetical protein